LARTDKVGIGIALQAGFASVDTQHISSITVQSSNTINTACHTRRVLSRGTSVTSILGAWHAYGVAIFALSTFIIGSIVTGS